VAVHVDAFADRVALREVSGMVVINEKNPLIAVHIVDARKSTAPFVVECGIEASQRFTGPEPVPAIGNFAGRIDAGASLSVYLRSRWTVALNCCGQTRGR
jgi:hypothetical protein